MSEDIERLKYIIEKKARHGDAVRFLADKDLLNLMCHDFWYDTTMRVNNYHRLLKKFHMEKYGIELVDGGEFGFPGDRQDKIIALEYYFFCLSGERMRKVEQDGPVIWVHAL